jgi:hypothetical protein
MLRDCGYRSVVWAVGAGCLLGGDESISFAYASFSTDAIARLALLLLNAGMNIRLVAAREWLRNGVALTSGLAGNFFIPLLYVLAVSQVLRVWHNPEEVQNILLGLALVASMPIAWFVDRLVSER